MVAISYYNHFLYPINSELYIVLQRFYNIAYLLIPNSIE